MLEYKFTAKAEVTVSMEFAQLPTDPELLAATREMLEMGVDACLARCYGVSIDLVPESTQLLTRRADDGDLGAQNPAVQP